MANSINNGGRSVSRGRDSFHSSGRGGAGNVQRSSISSDTRPFDDPDDSDLTRGREPLVHPDRLFSVGRGGAGNMRSPSREVREDYLQTVDVLSERTAVQADHEQRVKKHHAESNPIHSSGRGGLGNISYSRSRSRGPVVHSTGRGGAGNIQYGAAISVDDIDEEERRKHAHAHAQAIHSTGRGGAANLTNLLSPNVEHVVHHHGGFESSGRGGAGNIRSRSVSRDPSGRTPSHDTSGAGDIQYVAATSVDSTN